MRWAPWALGLVLLLALGRAAVAEEAVPPRPPAPAAPAAPAPARAAPQEHALFADAVERAPVIDGDLADWPAPASPTRVARLEASDQLVSAVREAWRGAEDGSAKVRLALDADFLYLAAEVTDDRLLHPGNPWFHGDSLELFLNASLRPGEPPPQAYVEGCRQILLMPLNPELAWGVIYSGREVHFHDGGLEGVRIAHRVRPGGYDLEVALPRAGLGLAGTAARDVGFALALTDADEEPRQETYLSWNGGTELYARPDRFGVLHLAATQPHAAPPTAGAGEGPPLPFLAVLLAIAAALLLAGPGARRLARLGPRPKAVALALTGLLAFGLHLLGSAQVRRAHCALDRELRAAGRELERIALDAGAVGALDDADGNERASRLARLVHGERLPCKPRLEEVALVPLLPKGQAPARVATGYAVPLDRPQRFVLQAPLEAVALTVRAGLEERTERRATPRALGLLHAFTADGTRHELPVETPEGGVGGGSIAVRLTLPHAGAWTSLEWLPADNAPRATLLGLEAHGTDGRLLPVPLSGLSEDGVPILAHAQGPQHARSVEPGAALAVDLPRVRAADRLWLVLSAERAYPTLAGDEVLALLEVEYEEGEPTRRAVRNGLDLVADRLPAGLSRPAGLRTRVAYRWTDASGVTHAHALVPVRVDPQGRARRLVLRNLGPGGRLTLFAATLARTVAPPPDGPLAVTAIEDDTERVEIKPPLPSWRAFVAPRHAGDVGRQLKLATAPRETTLTLTAPEPPAATSARRRTQTALLTCLAVGLFLLVLLAVDVLGRARRLAWRLALGVLAAALVPLAATIWLVERNAADRAEAEHAARARAALLVAQQALEGAQRRTQDVVRQLAGELAGDALRSEGAQQERLVRVTLGGVLPADRASVALATGSDLATTRVASEGQGRTLLGAQRVAESAERPGFVDSPWDGLLLVGSSRAGRAGRWARVTLGVRMDDRALAEDVLQAIADPDLTLVVLGAGGRRLAAAGPRSDALAASLAHAWPDVDERLRAEANALLPHLAPGRQGDPSHLARVAPLAPGVWLALGVDRARVEAALAGERERLVWLGLFALVLVVSVAALIARRVSDPIRRLVRVTESVRRGDFDVAAPPTSADEVGNLSLAFDQMRLDLRSRIQDAEFLRRAQDGLAGSLDLGQRARTVLDLAREGFAPDTAVVLGVSAEAGPAQVLAEHGRATTFAEQPFPIAAEGWIQRALQAEGAVEIHPERSPEVAAETLPGRRLMEGSTGWTAVALRAGGEVQGLLVLGYADVARLPRGEAARLLAPLASIAGVALNSARLYRLAAIDEVSRLPGATAFEAGLRGDVARALAGGPELWLVRVGLDHVERLTVRRGVEAARDLVRAAADRARVVAGGRAQLGRLGEDELAARLPGLTREEALAFAEALRERVRSLEVVPEVGGEPVATTASVGVARLPGDAASLEFLLHAAERAMLKARSEGGDRVLAADQVEAGIVDLPPFEEGAIFRNERMVRVVEAARRAARSDASVLITGETGTGKEVIANLVHRRSPRAERPFVTVNCAAFPETLLESELFGYERGAFTGAERRREGRFEVADHGTLFLDEIGEMSPGAQVKLLRVLQERQFTRLGGSRPVTVDVRLVAATNKDLEACVKAGTFREDLFYRLNVIRLEVPPLRERREEIPPLVEHFLKEFRRRHGRGPESFRPAAMDVLYRHPWPGNVRELKNVIERCAVLCDATEAGPEHLQLDAGRTGDAGTHLAPRAAPRDDLSERQRKLLDHLARHGRATNGDYQELTGTSARTGLRDLQDLIDRGLIVREGKRRGAVYRLV